jgi:dolichyl-phosphate beta-glucosyltransferase
MKEKKITLIIPAYNEAGVIENTVLEACSYFESKNMDYEIIVSADGNDGTREIVSGVRRKNPRIFVIGGVERRGKGYGIRQAIKVAVGDIIGYTDADNKTPINEFDKFTPLLLADGYDVIIGSRGERESRIERYQPWYRQIGSKGFGVFMHLAAGLWDISDTQCGFKFFQAGVARDLFSRQLIDGYMFDVEILFLARKLGYTIQQVPIRWRDDGDSRLDLISGNIRNFKDVLKIRYLHGR